MEAKEQSDPDILRQHSVHICRGRNVQEQSQETVTGCLERSRGPIREGQYRQQCCWTRSEREGAATGHLWKCVQVKNTHHREKKNNEVTGGSFHHHTG